jgi:hypothetical protein
MRAALIALTILLLPAALFAQGTIGIYFTGTGMTYSPTQWEEFDGYVLLNGFECYVNAVQFAVSVPAGLALSSFSVPEGSLQLGDPEGGIAISYWPPLNGFFGEPQLLCTLNFLARKGCGAPSGMVDANLSVVPDPLAIPPGVLATCFPDNDAHVLTGLTSIICPQEIAVQSKSWGAIKSLYEN